MHFTVLSQKVILKGLLITLLKPLIIDNIPPSDIGAINRPNQMTGIKPIINQTKA